MPLQPLWKIIRIQRRWQVYSFTAISDISRSSAAAFQNFRMFFAFCKNYRRASIRNSLNGIPDNLLIAVLACGDELIRLVDIQLFPADVDHSCESGNHKSIKALFIRLLFCRILVSDRSEKHGDDLIETVTPARCGR